MKWTFGVFSLLVAAYAGYAAGAKIGVGAKNEWLGGLALIAVSFLLWVWFAFVQKWPRWSGVFPGFVAAIGFQAGSLQFESRYEGFVFSASPVIAYILVYGVSVWLMLAVARKVCGR